MIQSIGYNMKKQLCSLLLLFFTCILSTGQLFAQHFITEKKEKGGFPIANATHTATIVVDDNDTWLVKKAADFLRTDIHNVTGKTPTVVNSMPFAGKHLIIIGSIGNSKVIDVLVKDKKINTDQLKGKWEAYQIQVVSQSFPQCGRCIGDYRK
jgi:hypothetical protein